MKGNVTFLVLVGVAGAITMLFVYPALRDIGRPALVIPILIFLVILFIYGRHNPQPRPKMLQADRVRQESESKPNSRT
jgi:hypothetical protein